jgi:hypothetical protein
MGLEHGSRGINIVSNHYQETSSEDTAEEWSMLEATSENVGG